MSEEDVGAKRSKDAEEPEVGELVIIVGCSESALAILAPGEEVARIIPRSELSPEAMDFE